MPGARLTQEDRRLIASALEEGHALAEIARRLGRPTSTVSREVTRNGGAGGYRPDHAHRATEDRARRRRRPRAAPAGTGALAPGRDPGAVARFEERFTDVLVRMGLPRMAARLLTCLYVSETASLTAAELTRRLQVSPASVSKAVGYLEGLDIVRRERAPGARRERYVLDDDVWSRAWSESARVNVLWSEAARTGADALGPHTPAGVRLTRLSEYCDRLGQDMGAGLDVAVAEDAVTVLAALVHAGRPLTADEIAAALGWAPERVTAAVGLAEAHRGVTGPVAVRRVEPHGYTAVADPDRLTAAQRAALR